VEGSCRDLILRCYPSICLGELRNGTRDLTEDSRSADPDLNLGPPEYEARVLTTRPRYLVKLLRTNFEDTFIPVSCS
jgi:hypothetical protein